ncbi:hypothetical protein FA13DRAFT_1820091, partial [Coprinellus micaceus]
MQRASSSFRPKTPGMAPTAVALSLSASTSTDAGAPRSLQEAVRHSTVSWQRDLEGLFKHAKDWFPDVVWELGGDGEDDAMPADKVDEVWGHKAIVYARAPPSFQSRYFSFRPNLDGFPVDSSLSLGLDPTRTPSPFSTPSITNSTTGLLRISTNINPALFGNELEYLYTGQGFGEAFEFLFDSSETRDVHHMLTAGVSSSSSDELDAESLRVDKLRKDLVFMWRSRLYSDVRIALTGNFSTTSHDNTTAIFSSHRFILVSRCPYFYDALLNWPSKPPPSSNGEPPTLNLPSPPFTPASLHFTLGYIYTGTLVFSHRSYDLQTAFSILLAATYLSLPSLPLRSASPHRPRNGRWGTTGCRCRQCARRAPRVLEFSLQNDVQNQPLERGARRALVGMFGEGWCTQEFASLPPKMRDGILRGVAKRTTPTNAFPLLFAAEHALVKLGPSIEPWADTIREMLVSARKTGRRILESEGEAEGARFGDLERVEWAMAAVLRGLKDPWAATLYQTLVSAILLRPHPGEESEALLSATSKVRKLVEDTRLEVLRWMKKRWYNVRSERGFDELEGWAVKEISDYIEVSIDDLLSPPNPRSSPARPSKSSSPNTTTTTAGGRSTLLRPMSQHPHTSRVDADSDVAVSMRSVLTRNTTGRSGTTGSTVSTTTSGTGTGTGSRRRVTPTRGGNDAASVRSSSLSTRSTATFETSGSGSTVGRSPALRRRVGGGSPSGSTSNLHHVAPEDRTRDRNGDGERDSPAKRLAAHTRAKHRAGSCGWEGKGPPSIVESNFDHDDLEDEYSVYGEGRSRGLDVDDGDAEDVDRRDGGEGGEDEEDTESVLGSGVAGDGDESTSHYADATDDSAIGGLSPTTADDGQDADDGGGGGGGGGGNLDGDDNDSTPANSILSHTTTGTSSKRPVRGRLSPSISRTTPTKKTLLTKVSLSSVNSRSTASTAASRVKSGSGASIRSINTTGSSTAPANMRKISGGLELERLVEDGDEQTELEGEHTEHGVPRHKHVHVRLVALDPLDPLLAFRHDVVLPARFQGVDAFDKTSGATNNATLTPTAAARSRKTSAASTVSGRSVSTTGATPVRQRTISATSAAGDRKRTTSATASTAAAEARQRKISTSSVSSSVASGKRSPVTTRKSAPPVPPIDRSKLSAGASVDCGAAAGVKAPSLKGSVSATGPSTGRKPVHVVERKKSASVLERKGVVAEVRERFEGKKGGAAPVPLVKKEEKEKDRKEEGQEAGKEDDMDVDEKVPAATVQADHRKTTSSASTSSVSSVATVKRRGSVDTVTSSRTRGSTGSSSSKPANPSPAKRAISPPLPPVPVEDEDMSDSDIGNTTIHGPTLTRGAYTGPPRGATLDIGIACIISSKRKRFKAYARYIGEVEGEIGPWVGVEVPLPVGVEATHGAIEARARCR